jgi:serine/threonine-protein kinase
MIDAAAARDERLAHVLEELSDQQRRGQRPDIQAVARQHPDLAEELLQLWGTIQLARELDPPSAHSARTVDLGSPRPPISGTSSLPRVLGDYELREELGRGGMGIVYKAWQKSLGRTVAIKMLLDRGQASAADLARFRVEAEAAARLEHPNIVSVYEVGECEGQPYFSMRYVEGSNLAERLAEGPLPAVEAARLLAAICRAVAHAHAHGILHRDLKPSNVLLDTDGQPHVTDFGLAKQVGGTSLTGSGAIVGTPSYMAPEQADASRGPLGPASDVYALGTILYELLTGRPPFQAASRLDVIFLVLDQEPVRPRMLNPRVDRKLEKICLKCLQKAPGLRYATAGQLADELDRFLQGEPLSEWSLADFLVSVLGETHHATVLENWGLLWMLHSLKIFLLCLITNIMMWRDVRSPWPYLLLWSIGLVAWGAIFWALRRRGGPVLSIERQIAHLWGGGIIGSIFMFLVEMLLKLPPLTLSPVLPILAGMVFVVKASMLSGAFYVCAAALFLTAVPMAVFPQVGPLLFGLVSAACFFFPGLKYYRQRIRSLRPAR